MKYFILQSIFILVIISSPIYAQNNTSINVQTTGAFIGQSLRIVSSPQVSIRRSKHEWSLGPAVLIGTKKTASTMNFPKLTGLQFTYKSFPLISYGGINFFLFGDLIAQRLVDKWSATIWSETEQSYVAYQYENVEYVIQNHLGYGLELKLGRHFQLQNSVGIGIYYSYTKGKSLTEGAPVIPRQNENLNGYSPIGFSWQIKLGLGFILLSQK